MSKYRVLAGLAGICAVVIGVVLVGSRTEPERTGVRIAPSGETPDLPSLNLSDHRTLPKRITLPNPAGSPSPNLAPSAALQSELKSARDWRAFALAAKSRPQEGGYFYARYAANQCGRQMHAIKAMAERSAARKLNSTATLGTAELQSIEVLSTRCASFSEGESSALWAEMRAKESDSLDPLMNAERQFRQALDSGRRELLRDATATLLRLDDPLLLSEKGLLGFVMAADPEGRRTGTKWFGGKLTTINDESDYSELLYATVLGVCRDNSVCGFDDLMQVACAGGGDCTTDRRTYISNEYLSNGGTAAGLDRILTLASRIRAAIASGSVEAFLR